MTIDTISNGSSNGMDVRPFTGKEVAGEGNRLAIIRYKSTTDAKTKVVTPAKPSVFVQVPRIVLSVAPAILLTAMQDAVDEMQDAMIRARIESGTTTFTPDMVNEVAIAAWSAEVAAGARLNKATILTWFQNDLLPSLTLALTEKFGIGETPDQASAAKLGKTLERHESLFAELAAPRPAVNASTAESLKRAAELAGDSSLKKQIIAKLEILAKKEVELLESL